MRHLALAVAALLLAVVPAVARDARPMQPDRANRAAILDASRATVVEEIGKPVLFKVERLVATDRWAFLLAEMQEAGRPVSYKGTPLAEASREGLVSTTYAALLRREGERWRVVDRAVGPTDVAWESWPRDHGAPAALFGEP